MKTRTDLHRPSAIIPTDYSFVCVNYRDEMGIPDLTAQKEFQAHKDSTGGTFSKHSHGGGCMVCGAWMMDYAIFHHIPSNDYIRTGCDCAAHIDNGHADAFRRVAQLRRAASKRNKKVEVCSAQLELMGVLAQVENYFQPDDMFGALFGCDVPQDTQRFGTHIFGVTDVEFKRFEDNFMTLIEMTRNLNKYGSFSPKQHSYYLVLCEKFRDLPAQIQKNREENEKIPDAPSGKSVITGRVVSLKSEESNFSYYGETTYKMLVVADEGFKVYVTVPAAISDVDKGNRVQFTANLVPSNTDPKFAIGKRPSKASIIEAGY